MRNRSFVTTGFLALVLAAAQPAFAGDAVTAEGAWVQMPMPGAEVAAAYVRISNAGVSDDRLLGVSSPDAGRIELHAIESDGGVVRMRPLPYGVKIPAGATVDFTPATMHLMLFNARVTLSAGEEIPLTLIFQHAGRLAIVATVRTPGSGGE